MSLESPNFETSLEKVKESALRFRGEIFTSFSHVYALDKLELKYPNWKQLQNDGESIEDGFITTTGRFTDREEAEKLSNEKLPLDFE